MLNKITSRWTSKLLFLGIGGLIGLSAFLLNNESSSNDSLTENKNNQEISVRAVREDEDICPIKADSRFADARVTFLPVPIEQEDTNRLKSDVLGKKFDPVELGKDLYKFSDGESPWIIEEFDIDGDLKKEKVYYGNIAMNHTPHVAYVIKDGVIVFVAAGANVWLDHSVPNGFQVGETLDWNIGKYKTTKYEYVDGKFKALWYQITCDVDWEK